VALGLLSEQASGITSSVSQRRPRGRWLGYWLVTGCVSAILAASVALAYASPPDPSWISGIYDDHDYDDVIGMVTDGTSVGGSEATPRIERVLVGVVLREGTPPIPRSTVDRQTIRGPPPETLDVDLLLTSSRNASQLSNIRLIHPGWSGSRAALLSPRGCAVSDPLDVHLIASTHKTPQIHRWLARHPRFHAHFTPTGNSLDQSRRALVRGPDGEATPPRRAPQHPRAGSDQQSVHRDHQRSPQAVCADEDRMGSWRAWHAFVIGPLTPDTSWAPHRC
jgi:hypothetical protein